MEQKFAGDGVDTSGDAVKEPEVTPVVETPTTTPPPVEPPKEEPPAQPPVEAKPAEPPKLLAGKYKDVTELEKGYLESQKGFHNAVELEVAKRMEAERAKAATVPVKQEEAAATIVKNQLDQMNPDKAFELMTNDPIGFARTVSQSVKEEVLSAIKVQETLNSWRMNNKDLLPYEKFVNTELLALAQERPELISDHAALLNEATGRIRNLMAEIRNQGKQEALTVKETVTPLNVSPSTPATPESAAKPAETDPVDEAVAMQQAYQDRRRNPSIYGAR